MNDRLTAAALILANMALIGGLAAASLTTPSQAQAGMLGSSEARMTKAVGATFCDDLNEKTGC